MANTKEKTRVFTHEQVDHLLSAVIGQTLEAVDKAGLFRLHAGRDKVKGIAGDIIEISVLGCNKDSLQEPDILVDGESKTNKEMMSGYTETNKMVHFKGDNSLIGKIVKVKIIESHTYSLIGELVNE